MDPFYVKCASNGLNLVFTQLQTSSEIKIEFIDPLCTLIKLGILAFKPNGTKISIHDNTISVQEPSTFQGLYRWLNSDERDQLHQLRQPILYFRGLELGFIHNENPQLATPEEFEKINQLARLGLKKLKSTYENVKKVGSMIKNCLDDYIKTLGHPYSREEYEKELSLINKSTLFVIYNEFTKRWIADDMKLIIYLFNYIETKESENVKNEIANSIDHLIFAKDLEINTIRPD
jgi:hypothetical protein